MKYKIMGEPLPVVICNLNKGETITCESGAMTWMSADMKMKTTSNGGVGKVFSRMISGENLFQNTYSAESNGCEIAFASKFPGTIRAYEITPARSLIVQKGGFLACTSGIEVGIHFKKKLSAGFFGGEGFIMQKISGNGTVFVEIDGFVVDYNLSAGEKMIVDTGYLALMDETCTLEIEAVPGVKNMLLGGEGIFNTVISGPGYISLQTMPISAVANSIRPYFPTNNN